MCAITCDLGSILDHLIETLPNSIQNICLVYKTIENNAPTFIQANISNK